MNYEELVKALRSRSVLCETPDCDACEAVHFVCTDKILHDAAAAIEALQAKISELGESYSANLVAAQNAQPHWVSVFDDLPRHNAVVVVSDGKRSWDVGQYHFLFKADDRTIWWWKKHTTRKVLWWMYKEDALPQPPQEVQDGQE